MNTIKKVIICSICLDDIEKDIEFLPCIHGFHRECIDEWIKEKPECPICKVPVYVNTPEQLDMYNYYKDRRERISHEESRFFHQISTGVYNITNNTNNTNTPPTNYVDFDSIINNSTVPTNGQIRNISNIISMFDILFNSSESTVNEQTTQGALPNHIQPREVNIGSLNENDEKKEESHDIRPAGFLRDIIQTGIIRNITQTGVPHSNSDDDSDSDSDSESDDSCNNSCNNSGNNS